MDFNDQKDYSPGQDAPCHDDGRTGDDWKEENDE